MNIVFMFSIILILCKHIECYKSSKQNQNHVAENRTSHSKKNQSNVSKSDINPMKQLRSKSTVVVASTPPNMQQLLLGAGKIRGSLTNGGDAYGLLIYKKKESLSRKIYSAESVNGQKSNSSTASNLPTQPEGGKVEDNEWDVERKEDLRGEEDVVDADVLRFTRGDQEPPRTVIIPKLLQTG